MTLAAAVYLAEKRRRQRAAFLRQLGGSMLFIGEFAVLAFALRWLITL